MKYKWLVTGGAGFIGSHLVDYLCDNSQLVAVLDNLSNGKIENVNSKARFWRGDIKDLEACRFMCYGMDFVLHLAAIGSVKRSVDNPIESHANNVLGTLNMLIASREFDVKRFIFASSGSVYGANNNFKPASPYGVTKLTCEHYLRLFYELYGLETVSLRYSNVFGPRQNPHLEYAAVVPKFTRALLTGEPVEIYGDGEQTRDFVYVEDVVTANVLAAFVPKQLVCGKSFPIGSGRSHTVNELFSYLKQITGASMEARHVQQRLGDIRDVSFDITNSKNILGYLPSPFKDGLQKTVDSYKIDLGV